MQTYTAATSCSCVPLLLGTENSKTFWIFSRQLPYPRQVMNLLQTALHAVHRSSLPPPTPATKGMDGMPRHPGRLPPCPDASKHEEIPLLPGEWSTLRIHLSPLRPQHPSPSLHFYPAGRTHQCFGLPRRSNRLGHLDPGLQTCHLTYSFRPPGTRLSHSLRQVSTSPEPTQGLAGLPMELSLPVSFALSIEPEQCIAMFTDSISAFYACLKQGSLKAPLIHKIYGDIFEVLQRRHLTLLPRYILGIRNVLADALPRLDPVSTE